VNSRSLFFEHRNRRNHGPVFGRNSALHVSLSSYSLVKERISRKDTISYLPTNFTQPRIWRRATGLQAFSKNAPMCDFSGFHDEQTILPPAARRPRCGGVYRLEPRQVSTSKNRICELFMPTGATVVVTRSPAL